MNASDPRSFDTVYPVTIVADRYGGAYSGGRWVAFPTSAEGVPDDPFGGDTFAAAWWEDAEGLPIGRGRTPDDALTDLVKRLEAIPPDEKFPRPESTQRDDVAVEADLAVRPVVRCN